MIDMMTNENTYLFFIFIFFMKTKIVISLPVRKHTYRDENGIRLFHPSVHFQGTARLVHLLSDRDQDRMEGLLPIPFTGTVLGSQMDKSAKSFLISGQAKESLAFIDHITDRFARVHVFTEINGQPGDITA